MIGRKKESRERERKKKQRGRADMDDKHRHRQQRPINYYYKIKKSSDPKKQQADTGKEGTVNLLEDGWFFGNSLDRKPRILRCNSDPCPSSKTKKGEIMSSSSEKNPTAGHGNRPGTLHRAPSLPVYFSRQEEEEEDEDDDDEEEAPRMGDLIRQAMPMPSSHRLVRAPSLPPCRVQSKPREEDHRVSPCSVNGPRESPGVGKLTRRASIDSSTILPPPRRSTYSNFKGMKQVGSSGNIPKAKAGNLSSSNVTVHDPKPRNLDRSKSLMSITELEIEELQGFKDLGFSFDSKEDISPSVASIIPGLKKKIASDSNHNDYKDCGGTSTGDSVGDEKAMRPYLSEAWENIQFSSGLLPQPPPRPPPPIVPKWADKNAISSEDLKAQIKFWARAVASNVRQEC